MITVIAMILLMNRELQLVQILCKYMYHKNCEQIGTPKIVIPDKKKHIQ